MRVRFVAPRGSSVRVHYLDSLHAALVNAWTASGVQGAAVVGREACNWSFGAVGMATSSGCIVRSVVVGAEGGPLEPILNRLDPDTIRKISVNGDVVDLTGWNRADEALPVVCESGDTTTLPAIMLSPLVLSVRDQKGRWHDDLLKAGTCPGECRQFPAVAPDRAERPSENRARQALSARQSEALNAGPHARCSRWEARVRDWHDVSAGHQRSRQRSIFSLVARDWRKEPLRLRLHRTRGRAA